MKQMNHGEVTQEWFSLHSRYNTVNYYCCSDLLLEDVLFWNPRAASWSLQENLSAEWHSDSTQPTLAAWRERTEENVTLQAERAPKARNRHGESVVSKVLRPSVRGCAHFLPWLIKSGWGLGQLTAHLAPWKPHTHARVCAVCHHSCIDWHGLTPFNCPWAEAVAKAESIISVVKVQLCTQLQTVSILSFFNIMDFLFFIKVCRQKCMHVPASQKNLTNNTIMRSYKYSSHWPEQGGVLIEMMLSCSSLRTFTQIHTQVLSAYNGSIRLLCDGAPITNCI